MHPAGLILPKAPGGGASLYNPSTLFLHLDGADSSSYPGSGSTWYDLTSNGFNFALNGITYDATYGAIVFNGTSDYALRANQIGTLFDFRNLSNGDVSVEFWIYFDNYTTSFDTIASQGLAYGSLGTTYSQWHIFSNSDYIRIRLLQANNVYLGKNLQNGDGNYSSSFTSGTWYHFVVTFDQSAQVITWYQNGADVGGSYIGSSCTSYRTPNTFWDDVGIGCSDNNGSKYYSLDGKIAVFRMYDECVGATDVAGNFNYYKARFGY